MRPLMASYACKVVESRGRFTQEPDAPPRTSYQRDRDRIVHSAAFRRLKHKTQVFVFHEGDHFRTRLTHSLEVAQVARSIGRALGLDEDLTEALALAHDLGHTPFGHAGERELDMCMEEFGGFDHNAQALRIVTSLERRYATFDGLNLTWETLEGLVKHNGPLIDAEGQPLGHYAERGLPAAISDFAHAGELELSTFATAEAQAAAIADDIAYNAHDIDDGLRAGLFDIIDLGDVPLAGEALSDVLGTWPMLDRTRQIHETVRRVLSWMIADVIAATGQRVTKHKITSTDDVRNHDQPLVTFDAQMAEKNRVLQSFLRHRMYKHDRILEIMSRARRVVRDLFNAYMSEPKLLPQGWQEHGYAGDDSDFARQVCDFIAGMTDRYALEQHKRLFDLDPLFR
ncbi:MAG: deoxyguanosinetriphosphate triphosphohydrolase [Rhizobiales bacterium]|nr:deoxyguanosinetriphosphate triphosphohydrolase [Hyphomicrobiales bacterium]